MLSARAHGYDTNQLVDLKQNQLTAAFGLDPERFVPVMVLSIRKAAEVGYDSVRLAADKFTTFK
jgi:hypothetical protein